MPSGDLGVGQNKNMLRTSARSTVRSTIFLLEPSPIRELEPGHPEHGSVRQGVDVPRSPPARVPGRLLRRGRQAPAQRQGRLHLLRRRRLAGEPPVGRRQLVGERCEFSWRMREPIWPLAIVIFFYPATRVASG